MIKKSFRITLAIFILLIFIRYEDVSIANWAFNQKIPDWIRYGYTLTLFSLISFLILINKNRLADFHVDDKFIYALIITGVVVVIFYLPLPINLLVVMLTAIVIRVWAQGNFLLYEEKSPSNIPFHIIGSILPILPLYAFSIHISGVPNLNSIKLETIFFEANLPGIIFEEILFRGVLWVVLQDLNFKKEQILLYSIFAFWFSHYKMIFQGADYSFWVILPYISVYYGLMISKGQSLFRTFTYHVTINVLTATYKLLFS